MENSNFVSNALKEKKIEVQSQSEYGINCKIGENGELQIIGDSESLIDLADILTSLALEEKNDHVHLDNMTLLQDNSNISEVIIEKR